MSKPVSRCFWVPPDKPYYAEYHDVEWGVPVHDDRLHFEMLILEGAQAGLSWDTVLRKRAGYRAAFAGFDPRKVARFADSTLERLLLDPGIVRNRLKVYGAVKNARAFLAVQKEFGSFDAYVWRFTGGAALDGRRTGRADVPARTAESDALSKDMGKRGFTFVGSTILYAYMQAIGMVNDHTRDCFRYNEVKKLR
ncbi:MAG: DNA-3-methyladenine glycosylase I [Bryobacterales bacterium]|nr:DNA-3-methyladenine glycosylase I [Bryobacterales bacterium]